MQNILTYVQVGSAVLLVISILLQQRGSGLGSGIGGSGMEYSTKRGVEKGVFLYHHRDGDPLRRRFYRPSRIGCLISADIPSDA